MRVLHAVPRREGSGASSIVHLAEGGVFRFEEMRPFGGKTEERNSQEGSDFSQTSALNPVRSWNRLVDRLVQCEQSRGRLGHGA